MTNHERRLHPVSALRAFITLLLMFAAASCASKRLSLSEIQFAYTKGQLNQIAFFLREYVETHNGCFPEQFADIALKKKYSELKPMLTFQEDPKERKTPWLYFHVTSSDLGDTIVVAAPYPDNVTDHGRRFTWRSVILRDFSVTHVNEDQFLSKLVHDHSK